MKWRAEKLRDDGAVSGALIVAILAILISLGLGAGFYWSYIEMAHYKNDANSLAQGAAKDAADKQKKSDKDAFGKDYADFPNAFATFQAPAQFGNVTFQYPRTWSQYVAENDNKYVAYMNPTPVPPIGDATTPFAIRVVIDSTPYNQVIKQYQGRIQSTPPLLSATTLNTGVGGVASGTRIDGQFTDSITGAAAFFDILGGNYTLEIFSDSQDFVPYFDQTILPTLKYQI